MKRVTSGLMLGLALTLVACGGDEPPAAETSTRCESAFEEAEDLVLDNRGLSGDLFPAVSDCKSLEEWTEAAEKFPEAIVGMEPMEFLSNLCTHPEVASEGLCLEIEAQE